MVFAAGGVVLSTLVSAGSEADVLRDSQGERARAAVGPVWALIGTAALAGALPGAALGDGLSVDAQQRLLDRYCRTCHNFTDYAGGVEFEVFNPATAHQDAALAERMMRKLRAGMMPPIGKPRPDFATEQAFAASLEAEVDAHAPASLRMPRLHRLNRTEYQNAVRDLLALDVDALQLLPADDSSRGFDDQAGTLTLSPALLEAYLSSAARLARLALGTATSATQVTYTVPADTTQNYHVEGLPLGTRGGLGIRHTFPADGTYTFKVFAVNLGNMGNFRPFGEIRGEQLLVYVDDRRVATVDWDKALNATRSLDVESSGQLRTIDVTQHLSAGPHRIGVTFLATQLAPGLDLNHAFDRSTIETGGLPGFTFYPHIGKVRIDGPVSGSPAADTPSRDRIILCRPQQAAAEEPCARRIAAALARHAYRGYASPADIDTLMKFYALGHRNGSFDQGIEALVQRVLSDPKFIFRVESAPAGLSPGAAYHVSDLDLASRLSFFLWSSIPDEELLGLAESGQLQHEEVLRRQVRRMLADPRAAALTTSFADQWLGLRALAAQQPVLDLYPDFDDNLRQAFRQEVELFFTSILREDRSVLDLLSANYTFVNERLAMLYGIPGVKGSYFRRIVLPPSQSMRFGLLGKGGILTITAHPDRTSPVVRGNWILRTLLGSPAPSPPPNVPALGPRAHDATGNSSPPSMRAMMEEHRANPACAGCHRLMDPIGFALESFDAIGRWRTQDGDTPIDPRSELYDGTPVDGPAGVREFLLRHREQYLRNFAANLLTYATGRGVEYADMPTVRGLLRQTQRDGYRLAHLIEAVAMSDVMRMNIAPASPPGQKVASSDRVAAPAPAGTGGD